MKSYRKLRLKKNRTKNKKRKNRLRGGNLNPEGNKCTRCGSTNLDCINYYGQCLCLSCGWPKYS
jgi:hypothetical protein